jgi:hypothetical protein
LGYQDVFQIIDRQELYGQTMLNVYFYQDNVLGSTRDAEIMLNSFEGQLLPTVLAFQSPAVLHTTLECQNLFVPADREVRTISEPGLIGGGDDQPSFNALGVAMTQDNGAVKNGAKRVGGIADSAQANGVFSAGGYVTLFNAYCDELAEVLLDGIIPVFLPVIVKRLLLPGGGYELPDTLAEAVIGVVTEAVFNPRVTSQVSRKVGVGI